MNWKPPTNQGINFRTTLMGLVCSGFMGWTHANPSTEIVIRFKNSPPEIQEQLLSQEILAKYNASLRNLALSTQTSTPHSSSQSSELLNSLFLADLGEDSDVQATQFCKEMSKLSQVKYCEIIPLSSLPTMGAPMPPTQWQKPMGSNPAPQSWENQQGYLDAAPYGIDARWAWAQGITGAGVTLHDLEFAWDIDHEEFAGRNLLKVRVPMGGIRPTGHEHGTAVLGEIVAANNGNGVTGGAHGVDSVLLWSVPGGVGMVESLTAISQSAKEGDIVLYEQQIGIGCDPNSSSKYAPIDYIQSVWDLTKDMTDRGVVVIQAAGNGSQNFDHSCYAGWRALGDNGSIMVGASQSDDRATASFSNYGARVDVYAWGDWSVYTTAYGDLWNGGIGKEYTSGFSGTSSASPIVVAAAALIQSWHKANKGRFLTSKEMRTLMVNTGTAQPNLNRPIGKMPNVRAAIESMMSGISSSSQSSSSLSSSQGSSSVQLSSSNSISSSSNNGPDCSLYPQWTQRAYEWKSSPEYVVWTQKLWSHANWTNGEPGKATEWSFVGDCRMSSSSSQLSSSSQVLSSSSSQFSSSNQFLSSSGGITANSISLGQVRVTRTGYDLGINQISWAQAITLDGRIVAKTSKAKGMQTWSKPLQSGVYWVQIFTSQGNFHLLRSIP